MKRTTGSIPIGFVWGFLFTGFLVKPPKENRFIYKLPEQPNIIILAVGIVLILVNTFVLGQGIYLN